MKLKFKYQQFQADAVNAVVDCFAGQPKSVGLKNQEVMITDRNVLANIRKVQQANGLEVSDKLEGRYNLTVEMETGTGKTYTYIKTIFELNKKYGWNKFVIVVPSIAIREGVYKSFQITEDHFMADYGMKARCFIYNSKQLHNLEIFASDSGINVMIINSQAFNARAKEARRIYMELDEFQTRRPIDVIARTNPILIIDEPQSVEGDKTKDALKAFNPLFTLRYSATPREDFNKIYRLDALDAYNKKLVKKITVKGITVKGTAGIEGYLYLEGIELSAKRPPMARIEFEKRAGLRIRKATIRVQAGDDLYRLSGGLEQYQGYVVAEVNGYKNTVSFLNGLTLAPGDILGDAHDLILRRIQIRETILSHFEKERYLFPRGIKVLSLFFIDEVAKYRQYGEDGTPLPGEYARIFEEEYARILDEHLSQLADDPYRDYLQAIGVQDTHKGYFSIDKKTNRFVDPKVSARETESDDADAYDLIMKDKERLLSFEEPTRFIFSHSALREGWDNPNVFQICTLKHSDSTVKKRQEVGRGLRLCVNKFGERMDSGVQGIDVHDINVLTVVASESYEQFARELQREIAEVLSAQSRKADMRFFMDAVGRTDMINDGRKGKVRDLQADDNAHRKEFRNLWHIPQNAHKVSFDSAKLVRNCIAEIDRKLTVPDIQFRINYGELMEITSREQLQGGEGFALTETRQKNHTETHMALHAEPPEDTVSISAVYQQKYDLIGKLVDETGLTRRTVVRILAGISPAKFALYRKNPEQFIINAAGIINEQKAAAITEGIM